MHSTYRIITYRYNNLTYRASTRGKCLMWQPPAGSEILNVEHHDG